MGEPLFLDVVTSLSEAHARGQLAQDAVRHRRRHALPPGVHSGHGRRDLRRAGRQSLGQGSPSASPTRRRHSLPYDADLDIENPATLRAVFYGLGSDGTVGANKNTVKILAEDHRCTPAHGLRLEEVRRVTVAPALRPDTDRRAVAGPRGRCRHPRLTSRQGRHPPHRPDGATLLLNSPHPADQVWDSLPALAQQEIIDRRLRLFAIDADAVAREVGLPGRTNTVLQACFFAISGVLPREEALERVKATIRKTYGRRGQEVVRRNEAAVDSAASAMAEIPVPAVAGAGHAIPLVVPDTAPEFVRTVTAAMMAGRGESLPVSAMPVDGTFPTGTTTYEKRRISEFVAEWDPETCIQCGNCTFVCPHSVIRAKYVDPAALAGAPDDFSTLPLNAVGLPTAEYRLQVYVEDCTGCGLCVEACPVSQPADPTRKAINLEPLEPQLQTQRSNIEFFETLPFNDRSRVDFGTIRGTQFLQPLFEFPGACAGCGETPYLKLLSQLFGERATIANATGCSSIYGGNLPTTPWTKNAAGRGPAWSNSLFEDNAEFGLGLRLAADLHTKLARDRLTQLRDVVGGDLADAILDARQVRESELSAQRERVAELLPRLEGHSGLAVDDLRSVADHLLRRSVWIVGGDGWAYDIGSGGLDHVLPPARRQRPRLDTEVYSNTGGQSSKSTPIGAVARVRRGRQDHEQEGHRPAGHRLRQRLRGARGHGRRPHQTLTAFREAEAYDGPSLIIAYSHCIAHGYDLRKGLDQQYKAVAPVTGRSCAMTRRCGHAGNPFQLDSPRPRIRWRTTSTTSCGTRSCATATRRSRPAPGAGQEAVNQRWQTYEEMATAARRFPADARVRDGHRRRAAAPPSPPTRWRRWRGDDLGHSAERRRPTVGVRGPSSTSRRATSACRCATRSSPARHPRRAPWTGSRPSPTPGWGRWCCPPSTRNRSSPRSCARSGSPSRTRTSTGRRRATSPSSPEPSCPERRGATSAWSGRPSPRSTSSSSPASTAAASAAGPTSPPDGGCRRGCARAQRLLRARRPAHLGARGRGPARRDTSSVKAAVDPGRGEAEPHFSPPATWRCG